MFGGNGSFAVKQTEMDSCWK